MKLCTDVQQVSGQYCKCFQGHKSKVKVTARPNALLQWRYTFGECAIEAYSFV